MNYSGKITTDSPARSQKIQQAQPACLLAGLLTKEEEEEEYPGCAG